MIQLLYRCLVNPLRRWVEDYDAQDRTFMEQMRSLWAMAPERPKVRSIRAYVARGRTTRAA